MMDPYGEVIEIHLPDVDIVMETIDRTVVYAHVNEDGHLLVKVKQEHKIVRQLIYRGSFLIEWKI